MSRFSIVHPIAVELAYRLKLSKWINAYMDKAQTLTGHPAKRAERLRAFLDSMPATAIAAKFVKGVGDNAEASLHDFLKGVGIPSVNAPDMGDLTPYIASNTALIGGMNDDMHAKVIALFVRHATQAEVDLVGELQKILGASEARARLIARDQAGSINAEIGRRIAKGMYQDRYRWSTEKDERVRQTHIVNEGKIFDWDNPSPVGHPGDDINCRCVADVIWNYPSFLYRLTTSKAMRLIPHLDSVNKKLAKGSKLSEARRKDLEVLRAAAETTDYPLYITSEDIQVKIGSTYEHPDAVVQATSNLIRAKTVIQVIGADSLPVTVRGTTHVLPSGLRGKVVSIKYSDDRSVRVVRVRQY